LDSSEIDADLRLGKGTHPLTAAAASLINVGVDVIPVVGLYRDSAHIAAAKSIIVKDNSSPIAVRLDSYDMETPSQTAKEYLNFVNKHFEGRRLILIFDCGSVHAEDESALGKAAALLDSKINQKSLVLKIVAGSGIPANISVSVPAKSAGYIERKELKVFEKYCKAAKELESECPAIFGDYATVNPNYVELDWALINRTMSPKILYALKKSWFVIRGGSFRSHPDGYDQYHALASEVRKLPQVSAPSFSFADKFIADCASKAVDHSGPGYWAGICINRHIAATADRAIKGMLI
jgi:hypothetical protein